MGYSSGKPEAELRQQPEAGGHTEQPSNDLEPAKRFLQGLGDESHMLY